MKLDGAWNTYTFTNTRVFSKTNDLKPTTPCYPNKSSKETSRLPLVEVSGVLFRNGPRHSNQTVAPTIPPITQNPEFSTKAFLTAPLVLVLLPLVVLLSVPLGRVPLSTIVFVPLTF